MTTEAALRSALEEATHWLRGAGKPSEHESVCETLHEAEQMIAAALALPVEERMEYRVQYILGGPQCMDARDLADAQNLAECLDGKVTIEARSVSTGPWLPLESV